MVLQIDRGRPLFDLIEQAEQAAQEIKPPSKKKRSKFPGPAVDANLDDARLTGLQLAVFQLMQDGEYRTHSEMKEAIGKGSENGIAAMLRGLRNKRHGHHTVLKRRRGDPKSGLWEYKLVLNQENKRLQ